MLVSRKKQHTVLAPSISVYGSPLESTSNFKYFGLPIASDLSCSTHIENVCSKANRILGLVYRCFCKHSDMKTLRQLYVSLVWPHLEYAAAVCSLHLQKDIATLEKTQYFAARLFPVLLTSNKRVHIHCLRFGPGKWLSNPATCTIDILHVNTWNAHNFQLVFTSPCCPFICHYIHAWHYVFTLNSLCLTAGVCPTVSIYLFHGILHYSLPKLVSIPYHPCPAINRDTPLFCHYRKH